MSWHLCSYKHLSMLVVPVLLLMGNGSIQGDPVTIMTAVSPQGMNYLYDFAITNYSSSDPLDDLISVDFNLPGGSLVGMATAPMGNGEVTDPNVSGDFVEFSSDNLSGFAVGATVDGFQFIDKLQLIPFSFTANYLDSTGTILTTFNGTTTPQASAIPEPSTLGLFAGASLVLISSFRRMRRAKQAI